MNLLSGGRQGPFSQENSDEEGQINIVVEQESCGDEDARDVGKLGAEER